MRCNSFGLQRKLIKNNNQHVVHLWRVRDRDRREEGWGPRWGEAGKGCRERRASRHLAMHYTDEYSTPGDTPPALHHAAPSSASRPCREDRDHRHRWTKDKKFALAQTKRRQRCILNKYRLFVIVSGPSCLAGREGEPLDLLIHRWWWCWSFPFRGVMCAMGATAAAAAAITRPHLRTKLTPKKCCRPKERGRPASSTATAGHELLGQSLHTRARRSPRNGRGVYYFLAVRLAEPRVQRCNVGRAAGRSPAAAAADTTNQHVGAAAL
ncbi:hypothetical protein E2C01_024425 [Portunus trituberculatus]|uniref:Uncharacterized protein n=1 Tax=Portunus trituberculatus TaxID=210409 RepID=A0A5B7ED51_PORTR|nr:hypothetical protein [Portunus trituberculatus]